MGALFSEREEESVQLGGWGGVDDDVDSDLGVEKRQT